MTTPRLIIPHPDYAESYAHALENGLDRDLPEAGELYQLRHHFAQWFDNQFDLSIPVKTNMGNVPRIPHSLFWLVDDKNFLGRISVRHTLTDFLKLYGGHIGYHVASEHRGKGYGHLMMQHIIPEIQKIGLTKCLIVIDEDNIPSQRVAEKSGAIQTDKVELPWNLGQYRLHYWLDI